MPLGYLVSQYPAINHTFVLREIRGLRAAGIEVFTVSVRKPDRAAESMTAIEQEEARRSRSILGLSSARIAGIHLKTLLTRPAGYLRGLAAAVGASGGAPAALARYLAYFAEAVVAGRLFIDAGVRHFHVHFSSTVGWLAVKIFPLEMSITFHGPAEFVEPASFQLREKIEAAVFVRAISTFGASQMMLAAPYTEWAKIEVVRLGVDLAIYRPVRRETGDAAPVELICVGRLAAVKGQHVLLEALSRVLASGVRARLRLIGDGPDRASLEEHAAKLGIAGSVAFDGWIDQDRILDYYARADAFVLASFAEGIPVVLMEAMAMELPVIATWVCGVPELVDDGKDGALCAAGDADVLAARIIELAADGQSRARMGGAARAKIQAKYNLEENVKRLVAVFERRLGTVAAERAEKAEIAGPRLAN